MSQDFEAPLVGWATDGILTNTQNSISPVSGSVMLSLNANGYLESPSFNLPVGSKYVTFWLNANMSGTDIIVKLSQNYSPILNLGNFQNFNLTWSQKILNIPAGYIGNNYTILFEVPANAHSLLRYYLDDIKVEVGQAPTSISERYPLLEGIALFQEPGNEHKIIVKSSSKISSLDLCLFDLTGRQVFSIKDYEINSSEQVINLPFKGEGIYILYLQNGDGIYTKKIILH
ncbi:MAG: T9SS type A sorting domain-containing protein [Bacteroidota bacterium]